MTISAAMVKELRERTGSGMMECKKALGEANGDLDTAVEILRKSGLAKADKKSGRTAAEGLIIVESSADGRCAAMLEVNCETDFVAEQMSLIRTHCRHRKHRSRKTICVTCRASQAGIGVCNDFRSLTIKHAYERHTRHQVRLHFSWNGHAKYRIFLQRN